MKRLYFTIGLLTTICSTGLTQVKNFIDQPYIEVTGHADTLVTPNQIFIKFIISEKDTKDKTSVEELERKMISAFKSLNINTEIDLTTSDMLSNYKFYLLKQKDVLKSKEYILKVPDAAMASRVFIQLEDIGISNTSIDKIDHTNLQQIENACRARAVANAKVKAIAMTKPIMQTIGPAIHIADNVNLEQGLQGRVYGISVRGSRKISDQNYEPPKIEFEKIKVQANVNVIFTLK